ncbi:alpha/beta hydrolase [Microbacterium sp. USHLN186]|uniref:alpha/beta hydrolase n=1 Tax=Microbacterium sp. USHLN186 TaxID=3081286 RepID=UPI003018E4B1
MRARHTPTDSGAEGPPRRDLLRVVTVLLAAVALVVATVTALLLGSALLHLHPAYPILLLITALGALLLLMRGVAGRRRAARNGRRRVLLRALLLVPAILWLAVLVWLRPYPAQDHALQAMRNDDAVTVTETMTEITLLPKGQRPEQGEQLGVFFQPGALVDARAYAATLRPLAERGLPVVIAKQPLNIAFLALDAFDQARAAHPSVREWVVSGHSLGGTVAAMHAEAEQDADRAPAAGLLLYASYPAGDISDVLRIPVESVSGSRDGLATPAKIAASREDLPADAHFMVIEGAVHAQFGDYGPQAGDGRPTISDAAARQAIVDASTAFLTRLSEDRP